MKNKLKPLMCCALACFMAFSGLSVAAQATASGASATVAEAEDISSQCQIDGKGFNGYSFLTDKKQTAYRQSGDTAEISIKSETEIASLYIIFKKPFGEYILTDALSARSVTVGKDGFAHEFIDVAALFGQSLTEIKLSFSSKISLSEIFVFSKGETPEFVQKWAAPLEGKTDLLLFSTHGDDEQLYFAGLLPHYAVYKGYNVQVVYLTDHHNIEEPRMYEMLNGLWAVGITAYPVFGEFDDFRIDSLEKTYKEYERLGVSRDDLLSFVTEQIRRFEPLVTVGHDFKGEYGHGMHQVYADLVSEAISVAADAEKFPESAAEYGTWQISKAYFHLYGENKIVMDYDTLRDCFDGLSAFQVTQKKGFPCHASQQWGMFKGWLNGKNGEITKATQIEKYNPAEFGLYFTNVGEDSLKNDMFENVVFRQPETLDKEYVSNTESTVSIDEVVSDSESREKSDGKTVVAVAIIAVAAVVTVVVLLLVTTATSNNNRRRRNRRKR